MNSHIVTMGFGNAIFFSPSQGFACQGVIKGYFGSQSGSGELVHT